MTPAPERPNRCACADLPALALQLLLRAHPDWKALPVAVVDADEPNGILLWVNPAAWRARLRPGLRYAAALALEGRLRAGVVAAIEIDEAVAAITRTLRMHTPHVEPSREEAGVFWLDASGLTSLYASTEAWTATVARALRKDGYDANVVTGFTRFGTYALAKASRRRAFVCQGEDEERRLAGEIALERLGVDPKLRDSLQRLGVRTVGQFAALPPDGIRRRFGEAAWHLHRRARGEAWDPLLPLAPEEPRTRSLILDDPVTDRGIILFLVRRLLGQLTQPLAAREQGIAGLRIALHRSLRRDVPPIELAIRTAEATLDEAVLTDLVRLRLEAAAMHERGARVQSIIEIEVEAEAAAAGREQLRLFHERTRRDLAAGGRALARLRAEFGEGSVVRAVLRQGHLPEACYGWERADKVVAPSPRVVLAKPLVRRIHDRAAPLPPRPFRERDDCWIESPASGSHARQASDQRGAQASAHGRVEHMIGPFVVSGGWWNREIHREYHYASTENGDILWVYFDRQRRRWFLAGKVE